MIRMDRRSSGDHESGASRGVRGKYARRGDAKGTKIAALFFAARALDSTRWPRLHSRSPPQRFSDRGELGTSGQCQQRSRSRLSFCEGARSRKSDGARRDAGGRVESDLRKRFSVQLQIHTFLLHARATRSRNPPPRSISGAMRIARGIHLARNNTLGY